MSFSAMISQVLYTLIPPTLTQNKLHPKEGISKAMNSILLQSLKAQFLHRHSLPSAASARKVGVFVAFSLFCIHWIN